MSFLPDASKTFILRFISALLIPLMAFVVQWVFWEAIQPYAWFLFYPAVFFSSWIGGKRAGMAATALSIMIVWWFFIPPRYSFALERPSALLAIGVFAVTGGLFSLFHERLRETNKRLQKAVADLSAHKDQLEERINERTSDLTQLAVSLRESEERYRTVVEDQTEVICRFSADGTFTFVNDVYCRIFGKTKEELIGTSTWHPIAFPEDLPLIDKQLHNMSSSSPVVIIENRVFSGSGDILWMQFVNRGFFDKEGKLIEIQVVGRDITARKDAEANLLESNERLNMALSASKMGVWDWDLHSNSVHWSPEVHQIVGLKEFNGTFEAFAQLLHPDDAAHAMETVDRALTQKKPYIDEFRIIRPDGEHRWLFNQGSAVYDENRVPLRLMGTVQDITERKQIKEQMRESEERFQLATQAASIGIWDWNIQRNKMTWDEKTLSLYGIHKEDFRGGYDDWSRSIHVEDRPFAEAEIQAALRGERDYAIDFRIVRPDGSIRYIKADSRTYFDQNGNPLRMIGTNIDITDRIEAEHEKLKLERQAKVTAESANRAKSEFLANMSHEIRTPMGGVLGMAQLLEMTELTPEQREYLAVLKISGSNLISLIDDILDLSKIEAEGVTIEIADFSPRQLVNDVYLMGTSLAAGKPIVLNLQFDQNIPGILAGDQLRIRQILDNLVGNAVKFTEQGNITISAQLLEQHDGFAVVSMEIRDTGIGISSEALKKVFAPFTQEDGSITRRYGGTGLGLTISHRLAKLMGGDISVESVKGVGSCFNLTLQFSMSNPTATALLDPVHTTVGWDGPLLSILLVEDDPANNLFAASLLRKLGHSVVSSDDGSECLAALEKGVFDIVLMDINMPIMSGEEALREIRKNLLGSSLHQPIIAVTAYSMRGDRERLLKEGFDGYVSKPLSIADLMGEIKRVVGKSVLT